MIRPLSRRHATTLALGATLATVIAPATRAQADLKPIKIGVTAGPHAQIFEVVKPLAARAGLQIQIIEFNDYIQPNAALAQGELDANSYQHKPFLDQQNKDRGYKLVPLALTVTFPIGIYSKKVKSLSEVPSGGRIAIPNDPTNGGRVLLLMQKEKVFTLKADVGVRATVADITDNPRKIRIIELDAAQLPRALDDVDAAAINTNYAVQAGLQPRRDAIAIEAADSPYANLIAIRAADKDRPEFAKLVAAYHSPEVKKFVLDTFQGAVLPAW
ncbi:MetQ/NlpA family ABC transporter substrate-binding protein [Reyranella sp. CPCC 100927]|uniref:MetQ/NlpA family ABC transporter substrate-binding protein n=1 Tax=Reyranella sp. CPCC 100927 TaxID=2599616 RepID=UPI0011B57B27|nr:MetQ/NlpA family ABC transporter substrate-binding protein [Reyranella sp. CPCC 100927]TWT04092.1 MetQ/NlpA family ABC transporter substrate-binding protein [Reyranella sp. CPCC 100927]